jgi:dihydrofolate reductase
MRKLVVFNQVSVDGYFCDARSDMSWAHKQDPEWRAFTEENARGGGVLVFGRVTYEMMASFWPTPAAATAFPALAEHMNGLPKIVFSRRLGKATWNNTRLVKDDAAAEIRKLKQEAGPDLVIFGSGTLVSQLSNARLIDSYQLVVNPIALGNGRTMFQGIEPPLSLRLEKTRQFKNGNIVLWYQTAA